MMSDKNRRAKINIKLLIVMLLVVVALGISLFAAREVRRVVRSNAGLKAGTVAFDDQDWSAAYKSYSLYLVRHPDDVEILKKFAKAGLSIRPVSAGPVKGAMSAYRRIIQLSPSEEVAYDELAAFYTRAAQYEELAYIAGLRIKVDPNSLKAPLWSSNALMARNKDEDARETLLKFVERLEPLPDKHVEYVQACIGLSRIETKEMASGATTRALGWLTKAVKYSPKSEFVEAFTNRARFYRVTSDVPKLREDEGLQEDEGLVVFLTEEERLALARRDLEVAGELAHEDPLAHMFLADEWMRHNELERAVAELQAAEAFSEEKIVQKFFDWDGWRVQIFLLKSELARRQEDAMQGASWADDVLMGEKALVKKVHRSRVLPSAVPFYIAADRLPEAREYLNEYMESLSGQQMTGSIRVGVTYLQALMAMAESDFYGVISELETFVASNDSEPELLRLLAEAYSRTDQARQAVATWTRYLRIRSGDSAAIERLAKEHLKLGDWNKALAAADLAKSIDPTDMVAKLLGIEARINKETGQGNKDGLAAIEVLAMELTELRQSHPTMAGVRMLQATIAAYLKQPEQAEQTLKLALEECDESLGVRLQLARHFRSIERMDEAIEVCITACERHPTAPESWRFLAQIHEAMEDYDAARKSLRQGLSQVMDPREKRSLSLSLAMLELTRGERDEGIVLLKTLAAQDDRDIQTRSLLLNLRQVRESQKETTKLIQELIEAEGTNGLNWRYYQASVWMASDDWRAQQQEIVKHLQRCLDAKPQWLSPALLMLEMHGRLRDFKSYEETCRRVLLMNPSASNVANMLSNLLEQQGRFEEAQKVLQQMASNTAVPTDWQARLAFRTGDTADISRAIHELELKSDNNDQDADSRILLASLLYQQTGDVTQAFARLKEAEAITPNLRGVLMAKVSILKAEGRTEEAQSILNDYVVSQDSFEAYQLRAAYLAQANEVDRAEQDLKKLTTFTEQGATGTLLLCNYYVVNKNLDAAVEGLEQGMITYPKDMRLKRMLMQSLMLRNTGQDRQEALDILTALEKQQSEDPGLMMLRVEQLLTDPTAESIQLAQEKLERIITLAPTAVIRLIRSFNPDSKSFFVTPLPHLPFHHHTSLM
ncbi:MAG: hypothetical protein GY809_23515, partial [Planctomycetes bacterium]|nr:hypothetical protein [Planctomycetota bacterium]